MKDVYYFSHDSNARNDLDILPMRKTYGAQGYGWYWIIVEILREQSNYRLKLKKHIYSTLALEMQCDPKTAEKFVSDCINEFELFKTDGQYLWSDSLLRRMELMDDRSRKARKAAEARWAKEREKAAQQDQEPEKCESNATAMQTQCDCNAIKVKESKLKEIDRKIADPVSVWENLFGTCSPLIMSILDEHEEKGMAKDLLLVGMTRTKDAIRDGPKPVGNTSKYFQGIINDWIAKDIMTVQELREYESRGGQADGGSKRHAGGRVPRTSSGISKTADIDWDKFDSS